MSKWADDLSFAQQTNKAVRVVLINGAEHKAVGVYEVNEQEGYASLLTPKTLQDDTTRTRIRLEDIAELTVLNVSWS